MPVVTYVDPLERRFPGVRNRGSGMGQIVPLTVKRRRTVEAISMALTHTSPSLWAPCASPTEKSLLFHFYGE